MLALTQQGQLQSLQTAFDLLLITAYQSGQPSADDLVRLRDESTSQPLDKQQTEVLAHYLAQIHVVKKDEPALWQRRLRDLIGHGEDIMGLTDSYPPDLSHVSAQVLQQIEQAANGWRWRLKPLKHRLCQVHGDFHPFFDHDTEFYVLARSRGAWGEAADDVNCLSINYIFFSLQRAGQLTRPFDHLHDHFWHIYLVEREDEEITAVIQPWLAWRALVLASPIWYPALSDDIRRQLLTQNGVNVIIAATAPRRAYCQTARACLPHFVEVYVTCPVEVCRARDPKGLWRQADRRHIISLPGVGVHYESPLWPELRVNTAEQSVQTAVTEICHYLEERFHAHGKSTMKNGQVAIVDKR